jgi:hypothetical protein
MAITPPKTPWFTEFPGGTTQFGVSTVLIQGGVLPTISESSPQVTVQMQQLYPTSNYQGFSTWSKTYSATTQNLLTDEEITEFVGGGSLGPTRQMYNLSTSWTDQIVTTTTTYNFMNNPLIKTVDEHEDGAYSSEIERCFQSMANANSNRNRTVIPSESEHRFQWNSNALFPWFRCCRSVLGLRGR